MDVKGISHERQNNLGTISNNAIESKSINESVEIQPVFQNEAISREVNHGSAKQDSIQEKDIKKAVDKLNKFLEGESTYVEYERHEKLKNQFVVKIVNNKTKEVIKEIPSKKVLDMVAEMCKLAGVIFDEKA